MMLFKRLGGGWTQLGSTYAERRSGRRDPAHTLGDGLEPSHSRRTASPASPPSDSSLTGGAPGIMAFGTPTADNWSGGATTFIVGATRPTRSVGPVTGLSGTVVLADNAGDALTVDRRRPLHLPHPARHRSGLQRDGADQPHRADLHGPQRLGHPYPRPMSRTCRSPVQHRFVRHAPPDDFNRANGSLGPNWTDMNDAGLAISSQRWWAPTRGDSGDIRTAEVYASDQYSTVQITSTPLSGSQWVGPMVRAQGAGSGLYVGLYFWNNGNPELMLFKRVSGTWSQLGPTYPSGALAAGTQLTLTAAASTLTFAENGVDRITATDTSLTGGAPGIMASGTPTADNWCGGNVSGSTPAPASTYTIGGTVSGLSGTVVLQDNGADNLSVSSNGTFTFPTSLLAGQAYNVTVADQPHRAAVHGPQRRQAPSAPPTSPTSRHVHHL